MARLTTRRTEHISNEQLGITKVEILRWTLVYGVWFIERSKRFQVNRLVDYVAVSVVDTIDHNLLSKDDSADNEDLKEVIRKPLEFK